MTTQTLGRYILAALSPLSVLILLAAVPVSRAADIIPDSGAQVAVADTVAPSDVENVKAAPGDSSVTLTWNVATDNVGVKGYKVHYGPSSVSLDGSYAQGPIDVGNKITYTVAGLKNGTKYYFGVTAYDAAGNGSTNYSLEVSATPDALKGAADKEAPKVAKVEAVDKAHVRVTFSEAVQLPAKNPESAFTIKNDTTLVSLAVNTAVMDPDDKTNKSVLLTTANQQAAAPYVLTAGIQIKDLANNPVVSGTSDTATFNGSSVDPVTQQATQQKAAATEGPQMISVLAKDATHVEVTFSTPVVLKADPRENFIITEQGNIENQIDVTAVSANGVVVTVTTAPQKAVPYNFIAVDVADTNGKVMTLENNAKIFTGIAADVTTQETTQQSTQQVADTVPPEDATSLVASMVKKLIVTLNWVKSINSAGDLANYILYMSTDGQNYGQGVTIDPAKATFDVTNVLPGIKYFFKLTAKDTTGNESQGVTTTFTLPSTGPELGLLLLGSLGFGKFLKRKKQGLKK